MKTIKINDLVNDYAMMLSDKLDNESIEIAKDALRIFLSDYDISAKCTEIQLANENSKAKAIHMFFVAKKIEGCTNNTLRYYNIVIQRFFCEVGTSFENISADDIRLYLAKRSMQDRISKCSQDNELRVLKSFFKWAFGEGYLSNLPTVNIKTIKQEKRIKKPFTEIQIEKMRTYLQSSANLRNIAIFEMLSSTGVRVSELIGMDRNGIVDDEITVFGKGEKERIVYLNAKAKLAIEKYIESRNDESNALFVSSRKPYKRLSKGAVERIIRDIGTSAGVPNAHPHRFRRTAATMALNRGMPIEQVQQMLGHESINTTTIYARSEKENVKASHRKYLV